MSEKKVGRTPWRTQIDKETGMMSGMRRIGRMSGSGRGGYYVFIPREFMERHNLREGDILPFVADHILRFIPVKEEIE